MNLGIKIDVHSAGAVRDIGLVKGAIKALKTEQTKWAGVQERSGKATRLMTTELNRQSNVLRGLTLQYGAVRRAVLTFATRGAIIGFTSITAAANSAAVSVGVLATSLANLAGAAGVGGGGMLAGVIQGFTVLGIAVNDLGKALTTTGQQHKLAMEKLTIPARQFVKETKKLESSWTKLKLIAQKGFFPGALEGLQKVSKLFPILEKRVYNTAQVWGYLAEKAGEMAGRRGKQIDTFLKRNARSLQHSGEAALNFGAAFLDAFQVADPFIKRFTKGIRGFSKDVKQAFDSKAGRGVLKDVFKEFETSWENFTATMGNVGEGLFKFWKAIQPVVHEVEDSLEAASEKFNKWFDNKDNRKGLRKFFRESLKPMGAFIKLIGALAKTWVKFAQASNDDATRLFNGLRTDVLPVLQDIFLHLGENLMPRVLELGDAFTDFIKAALPGLKAASEILGGALFIGITKVLSGAAAVVGLFEEMGDIPGLIATLGVSTFVIASWASLKREMSLALLGARKFVGLAPGEVARPTRRDFKQAFLPYRIYSGTRRVGGHLLDSRRDRGELRAERRASAREGMYRDLRPYQNLHYVRNRLDAPPTKTGTRVWRDVTTNRATGGPPPNYRPGRIYGQQTGASGDRGRRVTVSYTGPRTTGAGAVGRGAREMWRTSPIYEYRNPYNPQTGQNERYKGNTLRGAGSNVAQGARAMMGGLMSNFLLTAAMIAIPVAIAKITSKKVWDTPEASKANSLYNTPGGGAPTRYNAGKAGSFMAQATEGFKGTDRPFRNFAGDIDAALKAGDSKRISTLIRHIRDVGKAQEDVNKGRQFSKLANDVAAAAVQMEQGLLQKVAPAFEKFAQRGDNSIGKIRDGLFVLQNDLSNELPEDSRVYKEAMGRAFFQAADKVSAAVDAQIIDAKRGKKEIFRLMRAGFEELGFSADQARHLAHGRDMTGKRMPGKGDVQGAARGGFWVGQKGQRGRDSVPANLNGQRAVVAKGEYVGVFNASQQKAFDAMAGATGYGSMEGFFSANSKPHYMAGGGIVKLGHKIQSMGPYHVGEHPAFGGVAPVHTQNSWHYRAGALDVNADGAPGGEAKWLDKLAKFLAARGWHYLWRTSGHFDHLHVDMAGGGGQKIKMPKIKGFDATDRTGGLAGMVQGGVDLMRLMGNKALKNAGFGGEAEKNAGGAYSKNELKKLWIAAGGSPGMANLMAAIALAESSGNPGANGPPDGRGLWQVEWPVWSSTLGHLGDPYSPMANAKMANYILKHQGLGAWVAYNRGMHEKFLDGGGVFAADANPPKFTDPPNVNVPSEKGGKKRTKDKKKKKKSNDKPNYAGGMPATGRGYTVGQFRGKRNPRPPMRKKIKKLLKKSRLRVPGLMYDPVTGLELDPTQSMAPFSAYDKISQWMERKQIVLDGLLNTWGLSQEEPYVNDVVNWKGMTDENGNFIPGINQAVSELQQELAFHETMPGPMGFAKGFLGNLMFQKQIMEAIHPGNKVKIGKAKLLKLKAAFEANVGVRKAYRKKINKAKRASFTWQDAVNHNDDIIKSWRRWLRDSDGETLADRRQANSEIDRLSDENDKFREQKPKGRLKYNGEKDEYIYRQRGLENRRMAGISDGVWGPNMGGAAGKLQTSIGAWQQVQDAKINNLAPLASAIQAERSTIESLKSAIKDWTGTKPLSSSGSGSERDDILKQIGLDTLRGERLGGARFGALTDFAQMLGQRYVGAFAHGGLVRETGMALVHKGEHIAPSPTGPFRGNMNASMAQQNINMTVVVEDETGRVLRIVDSRMKQSANNVSRGQGRNTRTLRSAPGR